METRVGPTTGDDRQASSPPLCCLVVEGTALVVARAADVVVVMRPNGTPVERMVDVAAVLLSGEELSYLTTRLGAAP